MLTVSIILSDGFGRKIDVCVDYPTYKLTPTFYSKNAAKKYWLICEYILYIQKHMP